MRICSLLPSATEIIYALGLDDQLVGVTHECDYPPEARKKPVVSRTTLPDGPSYPSAEIDHAARRSLAGHLRAYEIDEALLRDLAPDLILTQELCEVCAVSYHDAQTAAARVLDSDVRIVSLEPVSLEGILANIRLVGELAGRAAQAEAVVAGLTARIERVRLEAARASHRPRVACIEWFDPILPGGLWVPEMVALAGGEDVFGQPGEHTRKLEWQEVVDARPEIVILMPCSFALSEVVARAKELTSRPGWRELPASQAGRIYAVDAAAYFSRSGPRIVAGLEILAGLIHPNRFGELIPPGAAQPVA